MKTKSIWRKGSSIEATVMVPTDRNGNGQLSLSGNQDDRVNSEPSFIRSFKDSLVGLIAAGTLAILSTSVAFAHGGGGGGHGGHFGGFGGHGFGPHEGGHSARQFFHRGHSGNGGGYFYDYPYYGYYDYDDSEDPDPETSQAAPSEDTIADVQEALTKLGYYHGEIDGFVGPSTERAIGWFQSVDKLAVSGRIDEPTLQALNIGE
jgi:hypothetical protein